MPRSIICQRSDGLAWSVLTAAALFLAACAPTRAPNVTYDPQDFGAPDLEGMALKQGPQRIGPLDKLQITIFDVPQLSGDYQVDVNGRIALPLVGTIEAQGKTTEELSSEVAMLARRYVKEPKVRVSMLQLQEQTITVDGSVREPGVLPIKGSTTLMRAVALARGTSEDANPSRVIVFRTVGGKRMVAGYDLRAIRRAESPDPVIYGNDIIVVDGSRGRKLLRDVLSAVPVLGVFSPF